MANVLLYNLAAMTVTTTGTGTITLGSAARINGVLFLSFASAGISNGDTVAYSILDPAGASEVGFGVYTSAGTSLTRNPTTSTNANAAINMSINAIVRISPRLQDIGTPGQRPATNTNDIASAGNAGELIEGSAALSSVNLTSLTPANITSISLTPGDWDVYGTVYFTPGAATTVSFLQAGTGVTSAIIDSTPGHFGEFVLSATILSTAGNIISLSPGQPKTYNLSATTTVFLICNQQFGASTLSAGGKIKARRVR